MKGQYEAFEKLYRIDMLRKLVSIEAEDREEWKVERSVIADIHKKILWAKYGFEAGVKFVKEEVGEEK